MTHNPVAGGPVARDPLVRLFDGSGLVGLTDGELLARFVATRDPAAFEGLVGRLGPMVLGVCRRMLGDRTDADDAFQATFLVLVRRARAVGRGDLIGPWLHGVAVRVCRKARAQAARRRAREQTGVAVDGLPPLAGSTALATIDQAETRAAIDDAIARLPATYRRLVILCDVEELTRAEAADRLGWTPNMVRGRLARARTMLRANLVRRGCVPPGFAAASAPTEPSGLAVGPWLLPPAPALVVGTARAALVFDSPPGRRVGAALASTPALHLAEGVLRAMFYSSWKFVGSSVLLGGSLAAGTAGVLLAQAPAQIPAPRGETVPSPVTAGPLPPPETLRDLLEARRRSAQQRYVAQHAFYQEGRITIDRLISASRQLMDADLALATTPDQRRAVVQSYVDQVQRLHDQEVKELAVGRATAANVAEAADSLLEAKILLAREAEPVPGSPAQPAQEAASEKTSQDSPQINEWRRAKLDLAREMFEVATRLNASSVQGPTPESLDALRALPETELATADLQRDPQAARTVALQKLVELQTEIVARTEAMKNAGRGSLIDLNRAKIDLLDAQIRAAGGRVEADTPATAEFERRLSDLERKLDRVLERLNPR